jgi:hypothetical protein
MKVILKEFYVEDCVIYDGIRDAGAAVDEHSLVEVLDAMQDHVEMDYHEVRAWAESVANDLLMDGTIEEGE